MSSFPAKTSFLGMKGREALSTHPFPWCLGRGGPGNAPSVSAAWVQPTCWASLWEVVIGSKRFAIRIAGADRVAQADDLG